MNWQNAILWENLFRFETPACGKWPSLFEFCFTKSLSCLHKVNIGTEVFGWELFCRDTCTYRKFKEPVARKIYFLSDECLFSFVSNSFLSPLKFHSCSLPLLRSNTKNVLCKLLENTKAFCNICFIEGCITFWCWRILVYYYISFYKSVICYLCKYWFRPFLLFLKFLCTVTDIIYD